MLCQRRLGNSSLSMSMSPPKCMVFGLTGPPCNRFLLLPFQINSKCLVVVVWRS